MNEPRASYDGELSKFLDICADLTRKNYFVTTCDVKTEKYGIDGHINCTYEVKACLEEERSPQRLDALIPSSPEECVAHIRAMVDNGMYRLRYASAWVTDFPSTESESSLKKVVLSVQLKYGSSI